MDYIGILKKSWQITWKYRALWVLGLFAGVTGPGFGGGSSGGSGGGSGSDTGNGLSSGSMSDFSDAMSAALPLLVAVGAVLVVILIVWWAFGIAARGGLVKAVDDVEEGRAVTVGSAWAGGFEKWGRVFLLEFVLGVPVFILMVAGLALVLVPIIGAVVAGEEIGPALVGGAIGGVCGGIAILALILPVGIVTGALLIIGTRYAVLDDMGAMAAIGAAWGALRSRFKDTAVMWLLNFAVNAALGFVVGIPIAVLAVMFVVPAIGLGTMLESWEAAAGTIAVMVFVLALVGMFVNAVWGTFTSAIWTVWWRRLTGREAPVAPAVQPAAAGYLPPPPSAPSTAEPGYTAAAPAPLAAEPPTIEEVPPAEDA